MMDDNHVPGADYHNHLSWCASRKGQSFMQSRCTCGVSEKPTSIDLHLEETISEDPTTGARKGTKLARFSLIPPDAMWALAEHYGRGALKYADRNWEKGYAWSKSLDALERHLTQMKMGEWIDQETGSAHMIAVAWHAFALFVYKVRGLGTNDIHPGLDQ